MATLGSLFWLILTIDAELHVVPQTVLRTLVVAALLLPITICVILGVGRLLAAMNDEAGWAVLNRVALGCGILWLLALVFLAVAVGVNNLQGPMPPRNEE